MESTLNPIQNSAPVIRRFDNPSPTKKNLILGLTSILVVLAGIGEGYLFSGVGKNST